MQKNEAVEKLAKIIEDNPDCEFVIDNDCWRIKRNEAKRIGDDSDELANSRDFDFEPGWYSGDFYGAGLAVVMLEMLNKRGFRITSRGC